MSADPHAATPVLEAGEALESARVAVVLVHGRGASAEDILGVGAALASRLESDRIAWLAPQAAAHTWYPQRFLAPIAVNQPWLDSALAKLGALRERHLPGLALANALYIALKAQGHGRDGTHALQLALATISGIDWKNRK